MAALTPRSDPTLAALDAALEAASSHPPRPYLGASQIGQPCSRATWYGFRWTTQRTIPAAELRRINDGHRGEQVLADLLRQVPGVTLWTDDPEQPGQQIGFVDGAGHFRGHVDGVIEGLLQAPKTAHVLEAKVCNEAKVRKLQKLIAEKGEKQALELWDEVYFAQAQIYMAALGLKRHYLTVATPGVRDIVSCRTDYQPKVAERYQRLAREVITAERPPFKISENASWYQCKFCDHHALCHGTAFPEVNCRTCAHSTAQIDEQAPWKCELHQRVIDLPTQRRGCPSHAFHPDVLANHATVVGADPKTGVITFMRKDGTTVSNGGGGMSSRDWAMQAAPLDAAPTMEQDVLAEIAADLAIPPEQLQAGELSEEQDFPALTQAVKRFSLRWHGDDRRQQALRALIEQVDCAYMRLAEGVERRVVQV